MSYDGISTRAIAHELKEFIGARINRVNQPGRYDLVLNIYKGKEKNLFLSAGSSPARTHFINKTPANPQSPPNFCMLLRKHIQGGIITDIRQLGLDRVLIFEIESFDELFGLTKKELIIEMMGRHSNIILVDKESQKINDSIKRVSIDISRVRQILPSMAFETIPDDKIDLLVDHSLPSEVFPRDENGQAYKNFYRLYTGLSPLVSREIFYRAGVDTTTASSQMTEENFQAVDREFESLREDIREDNYQPNLNKNPATGEYTSFYPMILEHLMGERELYTSYSEALEKYFTSQISFDRLNQMKTSIRDTVSRQLSRDTNKYNAQVQDLERAKDRDKYIVWADVLSANFHQVQPGAEEITLYNFYDEEGGNVTIPLDVRKTPPQNAQAFYKRYSRLKNTDQILTRSIPRLEDEIAYLQQVLLNLDQVEEVDELVEIEEELEKAGYLKKKKRKRRPKDESQSKPHRYQTSDGEDVYVGKNNRQNDQLTLRFANPDDYWFHVQTSPGSHVILRDSGSVTEKSIEEAAYLAALHSSLAKEKMVTIDYTHKKNVYKAKGAKPGMVYYNEFDSIIVDMEDPRWKEAPKKA